MKILLVEDDRANLSVLESELTAHHYSVDIARDGQTAIGLAEQFEFDLILLDVGLPQLDGISVCKHLRNNGYQLPIMLLTAKDAVSDRIIGLDAGADDYVVKPFHVPELLARIRALLRRGRTLVDSVVTWENLQLDYQANEIRYGEHLLRLTPKEYSILELFLLNPHRIFSKAALLDHVWNLEAPPTENAITSHIKTIRQKLKAAGANQDLIETMYGLGYRLRPLEQESAQTLRTDSDSKFQPNLTEAQMVMLELWERFKDSFAEQIALLEQVVIELQNGSLTLDRRQEAQCTVHKLVGSLGVYGFPHGSLLARQIEDLLGSDIQLQPNALQHLTSLVVALKQELAKESPFAKSSSNLVKPEPTLSKSELPLVLVVDDDESLTTRLKAEAQSRSLHIEVANHPAKAQQIVQLTLPDIILLELSFSNQNQASLKWLTTLRQSYPKLPVLVFTKQNHLSDRLAALKLGVEAFLPKSIPLEQIFQIIHTVLEQSKSKAFSTQPPSLGKVMVVDDDRGILHQLSMLLAPWGLEVVTLFDPSQFWTKLTNVVPDLLILDVEMPKYDGIELCQIVRNDSQWGNLPILFLTAHHDAQTIVEAFAAGGDDYIRKPILEPELIARVLNRLEPNLVRRKRLISSLMPQSE